MSEDAVHQHDLQVKQPLQLLIGRFQEAGVDGFWTDARKHVVLSLPTYSGGQVVNALRSGTPPFLSCAQEGRKKAHDELHDIFNRIVSATWENICSRLVLQVACVMGEQYVEKMRAELLSEPTQEYRDNLRESYQKHYFHAGAHPPNHRQTDEHRRQPCHEVARGGLSTSGRPPRRSRPSLRASAGDEAEGVQRRLLQW